MKKIFRSLAALLLLSTLNHPLSTALAQGTAFTYQGRLNSGTNPANGSFDLRFAVYDAATAGTQQGLLLTNTATGVTNGLFTVTLDFGNQFSGANRWLEIGVRSNGVATTFTTLAPRQPLAPTPYAIFANTASNLLGTLPTSKLTGSVGNGQLTSSSITVNAGTGLSGGGAVALGGTTTLTNAGVLSVVGNSDITANTANGVVTLGSTATPYENTNSLVKRDGNGSFDANTIGLSGNLTLYLNPDTSLTPKIQVFSQFSGFHSLIINYNDNFFVGLDAGNQTLGNYENTGVGLLALHNLTSGAGNTAVGNLALNSNTIGGDNTAVGDNALLSNIDGSANTALGSSALRLNIGGSANIAVGANALYGNTNGSFNTAVGNYGLSFNTSGNENTAIGYSALDSNRSGSGNTVVGSQAMTDNTNGAQNTALGQFALQKKHQRVAEHSSWGFCFIQ